MSIFEAVIGWLAPPVCLSCGIEGVNLCDFCSESSMLPLGEVCAYCNSLSERMKVCAKCRRLSPPVYIWVVSSYDGLANKLIKEYKFGGNRAVGSNIAALMANTLLEFNSDADIAGANYLVMPVPTATSRVRQRGFDHSMLLARCVGQNLNLQSTQALGRVGQTRQLGAKRDVRLSQPADSYYAKKPNLVSGRNILLIDDVITTGATLRAAAKILKKSGANRIDALVFAKRL